MNSTTYTPEQMEFAVRVSKALARVPEDRRSMLETIVESVLAGASIATNPVAKRTTGNQESA